jgi:serine/threonine protein kinase
MTIEIPGYQILDPIGQGSMGVVYLAIQESLQRKVALKVLNSSLTVDESFQERFLTEGRIVAQLKHPHIVTVHDIGRHGDHYYMDLEYAGDGSLTDRIKNKLSEKEAIDLVIEIASALAYAHKHGFVHRDVKPSNILFREDGSSVLSDFGIAKCLSNNTQLTVVGTAIGTPDYMSPEQAKGESVTSQSDIYSLGATFFEMLTNRRPYKAESGYALAVMHITSPPPKLTEALAKYQPFIDKCMAKDPKERYASCNELIDVLRNIRLAPSANDQTVIQSHAIPRKETTSQHTNKKEHRQKTNDEDDANPRRTLIWATTALILVASIGLIWQLLKPADETLKTGTDVTMPDRVFEKHFKALELAIASNLQLSSVTQASALNLPTESVDEIEAKLEEVIKRTYLAGNKKLANEMYTKISGLTPDEPWLATLHSYISGSADKLPRSPEQRSAVQNLLTEADNHIQAGRYFLPEGENAVETYQNVLLLQPENREALRNLDKIATVFETFARNNIENDNYQKAAGEIEIGLMISPAHSGLRSLAREHYSNGL